MPTYQEMLEQKRASVREVDARESARLREQGAMLVDIREQDEVDQGIIPGAVHIPRGFLEMRIEESRSRPRYADRRLLRRWCPFHLRRRGAQRPGLSRRRLDGRWIRRVESVGAALARTADADSRISDADTAGTC